MNFASLARRIKGKDPEAFRELYDGMREKVYSVCLGVLKDTHLAEDVMQDTFMTVWTKIDTYRGEGFKTWLLTVARNQALNTLRKKQREVPVDFDTEENAPENSTPFPETGIFLHMALEKLPDTEREIVLMKISGLKMKEIASLLHLPRGTVSWRYSEALHVLDKEVRGGEAR